MTKVYSNQFLTDGQEPVKVLYLDMCYRYHIVKNIGVI